MASEFVLRSIIVFALSGLPVIEMRVGIGLGMLRYHLHPVLVCVLAILGNLAVIAPTWFLFPHVERGLRRSVRTGRWLDRVFAKTRKETARRRALEEVGLFVIVALTAVPFPLPGSGLYTALVAAYIFGLPMRKAFPWLTAGIVVACILITLEFWLGVKAADLLL